MRFAIRTLFTLACAAALIAISLSDANAKPAKAKLAKSHQSFKKSAAESGSGLGTDFSFDAANVSGRYQYANEGNVTVENEKSLVDLLGMRRHFKDRLSEETKRQ